MSNDRLKYLLERYAADQSTPEEAGELFKWIKNLNDDSLLKTKMRALWLEEDSDVQIPETDWNTIYAKIRKTPVIGRKVFWTRVAAAAIIIGVLMVSAYWVLDFKPGQPVAVQEKPGMQKELQPGGDRAVLTLADGQQIVLDQAKSGALSEQDNVKVIKTGEGQLAYSALNIKSEELQYNTVSTPRGGQYQVVLSDGTKVWLNAASSLRFPVSFPGGQRRVELEGEGYFEVSHRAGQPFLVQANGTEVRVLGTHFNINAYNDEAGVKTTLMEGSVEVSRADMTTILRPGQQATTEDSNTGSSEGINIREVDVDAVIAWKNGRFVFKGENIHAVMRQLARWYDAEISYGENLTNEEFVGVINRSRYGKISDILDMLEKTRTVSFEVRGNHIKVTPFTQ